MAGEMVTKPLVEVLDRIIDHRGRTPKKLGGDFAETGIRVLSAKNVKEGRISYSPGIRYVSEEMHDRWMPVKLQLGDVLLTSEAPLGETAFLRDDANFCLGQRLFALRSNPTLVHSRYLHYALRSNTMQFRLHARATGTTAQGIRQSELLRVLIDFPSDIKEQQAIACILGTLDDKIDLNRRMNETLESMAQAIFKSWFVDFLPVHAKAAGQQPSGLAAHIADLFPDEFEESELGEIPKGWQVAVLADVAETVDCLHSKKPEQQEEGRLFLQVYNVGRAGNLDLSKRYCISEEDYRTWTSRIEVRPGDLVITKTGRVGAVAQIPMGVEAAIGRNIVGIRARECTVQPGFLRDCMLSERMRREIQSQTSSGTILQSLHVKSISKLRLPLPPLPLVKKYEESTGGIHRRMELNDAESQTLTDLRDTLLPKLISGELRVPDAERIVGRYL